VQGAAHFLEHLAFLGSANFPDEGGLDAALARHGGDANATTSAEYTVLQVDTDADALPDVLARALDALTAPLLRDEAAAREVCAAGLAATI
jgi:secreted Zn-dependent insulinase-like peptidase